ncbi:hypothetical protein D3C84_1052560 [compost metagenome]
MCDCRRDLAEHRQLIVLVSGLLDRLEIRNILHANEKVPLQLIAVRYGRQEMTARRILQFEIDVASCYRAFIDAKNHLARASLQLRMTQQLDQRAADQHRALHVQHSRQHNINESQRPILVE